jgi:hypothetical protein
MRKEENERLKWAQKTIEQELKVPVVINDDNSAPSMYDLRANDVTIEVVGAVDKKFTETWNVGPAKGPLDLQIKGDWNVTIVDGTSIKTFKQKIQHCLQMIESQGLYDVRLNPRLQLNNPAMYEYLKLLGITSAHCARLPGTGRVYYYNMPERLEYKQGSSLPEWVGTFLRDSSRKDVLTKLKRSEARAREVFILVEFYSVPEVESHLMRNLSQIPSEPPNLPPPVTGVWIVPPIRMYGKGLRWNGTTWRVFRTTGEGIDD